jgi:two-component system response regulator HydG
VLLVGESGPGLERVARARPRKSDRVKGPFFALNCAALPKDILENELFGHEKGAFTGSTNEKPGAFELADGGTLFLDEVAEMAPDIQVKLLRSLETRTVRRLGGKKEIAVDIRVVAATNKDVEKALAEGELREDLYYRLAVVEIYLPPLRERIGDIRLLASEFLARYAQENGKPIAGFDDEALAWIQSHPWPGNVRELKNAVQRAVVMSRGPKVGLSDIVQRNPRLSGAVPATVTLPVGSSLAEARRKLVLGALASTGGDLARAAAMAHVGVAEVRAELEALLNGDRSLPPPVSAPPDALPSPTESVTAAAATAPSKARSVASKVQKGKPKGRR